MAAAARLSRRLTPGDLDHTLEQITRAAVDCLPDVQQASITFTHADGRLESVAPTHAVSTRLDDAQYEHREGPCYEAAVDQVHVTAPDLARDPRFPRYRGLAASEGVRAQAALRLFDRAHSRAALNLYSSTAGAFEDLASVGDLFAHQSAVAIDYAREIDNLQQAMQTRAAIGQAVGVVMERYGMSEERAFAFLTRLSQHRNLKLRDLVAEFLKTVQSPRTSASLVGNPES